MLSRLTTYNQYQRKFQFSDFKIGGISPPGFGGNVVSIFEEKQQYEAGFFFFLVAPTVGA
jgi:hypothetical protein